MKIISAYAENFASYEKLEFNLKDQGLTLISGPTGSGKSTLCDLVPWVLFGTTAKNGSVEDIRSWNEPEFTRGCIMLESNGVKYRILRQRASIKSGGNDLVVFFQNGGYEGKIRGKDLADTQKILNEKLNLSAETYLAGAYLHEFSNTAQFFSTTAKNRRQTTEQLTNLSLATNLTAKISAYSKELKKDIDDLSRQWMLNENTYSQVIDALDSTQARVDEWRDKKAQTVVQLETKALSYESNKEQEIKRLKHKQISFDQDIEAKTTLLRQDIKNTKADIKDDSYYIQQESILNQRKQALGSTICKECGSLKDSNKHLILNKDAYSLEKDRAENKKREIWILTQENNIIQLQNRVNPYVEQVEKEKLRENTYIQQLDDACLETNPHSSTLEMLIERKLKLTENRAKLLCEIEDYKIEQSDLELLTQAVNDFRGILISKVISFLEFNTNDLLTKHFDAEIRVSFTVEDSDKLDVVIYKDGNTCSFSQLSKGQRQLLKLTFGVSVMKAVSNYSGIDFSSIWIDEALDGMDDNIKLKAFNMLEELSTKYESIFCVDHSESFKAMFTNKIEVELIDGNSVLK